MHCRENNNNSSNRYVACCQMCSYQAKCNESVKVAVKSLMCATPEARGSARIHLCAGVCAYAWLVAS